MIRNKICKGCGVSFSTTKKRDRFCSEKCLLENPITTKTCDPDCNPDDLSVREVTFKNGTKHNQQVCRKCGRSKYVSRMKETIKQAYDLGGMNESDIDRLDSIRIMLTECIEIGVLIEDERLRGLVFGPTRWLSSRLDDIRLTIIDNDNKYRRGEPVLSPGDVRL